MMLIGISAVFLLTWRTCHTGPSATQRATEQRKLQIDDPQDSGVFPSSCSASILRSGRSFFTVSQTV